MISNENKTIEEKIKESKLKQEEIINLFKNEDNKIVFAVTTLGSYYLIIKNGNNKQFIPIEQKTAELIKEIDGLSTVMLYLLGNNYRILANGELLTQNDDLNKYSIEEPKKIADFLSKNLPIDNFVIHVINDNKFETKVKITDENLRFDVLNANITFDKEGKVLEFKFSVIEEKSGINANVNELNKSFNEDIKKISMNNLHAIKRILDDLYNGRSTIPLFSQKTIDEFASIKKINELKKEYYTLRDSIDNDKQEVNIKNYSVDGNYQICDLVKQLPKYRKQIHDSKDKKEKQILIFEEKLKKIGINPNETNVKELVTNLNDSMEHNIFCKESLRFNYQTNSFSMEIDTAETEPHIEPFELKINFDKRNRLKNVECITRTENGKQKKAFISANYNFEIEGKTYNIKDMFLNHDFGLAINNEPVWQQAKGLRSFKQFSKEELRQLEERMRKKQLKVVGADELNKFWNNDFRKIFRTRKKINNLKNYKDKKNMQK